MVEYPLLTILIVVPALGALVVALIDGANVRLIRWTAFGVSLLEFIISVPLYFQYVPGKDFQFVEKYPWIPSWGAWYHIGIDGISLFLVLLTTFLTVLSILASWTIEKRVKEYMVAFLFLESTMIGVFVALDLLLFYLFWELLLIPMFLLIGVWGGPRRVYAAIKFFLYTMAGSVLMLAAIIYLYWNHYKVTGILSFDIFDIYKVSVPASIVPYLFFAFAVAFAIKVPMWPFHTWLPDAHVEAPTAGSVILAGVLLKMGTYGFMRFCMPLFPQAVEEYKLIFLVVSVIGIIYGALVALVQEDIKKLVAYSSVSHLGTCMLGLFALTTESVSGSLLQMINHGISTGALFLLVGMIYDRRHTRLISEYGGIAKVMPVYATFFMITAFSSCGLPGLNGFVGEFLTLLGTFKVYPLFAILGATATILSAAYLLWMYKRVFFHEIVKAENLKLKDLDFREIFIMLAIVIPMFWIGIYPKPFLERIEPSVKGFIANVKVKEQNVLVVDKLLYNLKKEGVVR